MSNSRLFPVGQLSIIEQGWIRGLCYTRLIGAGTASAVVENAWFMRELTPPPRASLSFRRSPVQPDPAHDVDDVHGILVSAWRQLGLLEDEVQAWGEYVSVRDSLPCDDPESISVPTPPQQGFAITRGELVGRLREMDGGEIFAYDPTRANLVTAHAFREPEALLQQAGSAWNEYWCLLADSHEVDDAHPLVVERPTESHDGLRAFLHAMQPRVNDQGAHLLVASVVDYGVVDFTAGGVPRRATGDACAPEASRGAGA